MTWRVRPLPSDWPTLRAFVLQRDRYRCRIQDPGCQGQATDVDHIVPASQGGTDHPDNLQAACPRCHRTKTAAEANAARWARAPRRNRPDEPHPGLRPPAP